MFFLKWLASDVITSTLVLIFRVKFERVKWKRVLIQRVELRVGGWGAGIYKSTLLFSWIRFVECRLVLKCIQWFSWILKKNWNLITVFPISPCFIWGKKNRRRVFEIGMVKNWMVINYMYISWSLTPTSEKWNRIMSDCNLCLDCIFVTLNLRLFLWRTKSDMFICERVVRIYSRI